MARSFTANINNRLTLLAAGPLGQYPITVVVYFKATDIVTERCLVKLGNASGGELTMVCETFNSGIICVVGGSGVYAATTPQTIIAGQWYLGVFVFESDTSRYTYLDGVKGTVLTTSVSPAPNNFNRVDVGVWFTPNTGVYTNPFNGEIGPILIIQGIPTQKQVTKLAARTISFDEFMPGCTPIYWKMDGAASTEMNYANMASATTYPLTQTGVIGITPQPTLPPAYVPDGILRPLMANQRYLSRDGVRAQLQAGCHTWFGVLQFSASGVPAIGTQDGLAYLDTIASYGHNITRIFLWDILRSSDGYYYPHWSSRSGTAGADDGGNKWDLTTFNQTDFFDRLLAYVQYADTKGILCMVMLSEQSVPRFNGQPWQDDGHPFKSTNNINSINGDPNADGSMAEVYTLADATITARWEAFWAKMCATLGGQKNVVWDIVNEPFPGTSPASGTASGTDAWIRYGIAYIKDYLSDNSYYQQMILRTSAVAADDSGACRASSAHLISPAQTWTGYTTGSPWTIADSHSWPPSICDTDHLTSTNGVTADVFWRMFAHGHGGAIHMEDGFSVYGGSSPVPITNLRNNLGYILQYSRRLRLEQCYPQGSLASTGHCISDAVGSQYLIYQPGSAAFTVNLTAAAGKRLNVEWFNTGTYVASLANQVIGGASAQSFTSPFGSDTGIVLLLTAPAIGRSRVRSRRY